MNVLTQAVDHLREDIQLYEAQLTAQKDETKAALQTLTEAATELEVNINASNSRDRLTATPTYESIVSYIAIFVIHVSLPAGGGCRVFIVDLFNDAT